MWRFKWRFHSVLRGLVLTLPTWASVKRDILPFDLCSRGLVCVTVVLASDVHVDMASGSSIALGRVDGGCKSISPWTRQC